LKWAVGLFARPEGPEIFAVSSERSLPVVRPTVFGAENSEVSPAGSEAVAVMVLPLATLLAVLKVKEALPDPSVVTFFCPTKTLPSSPPRGSRRTARCRSCWGCC
jgi:hypothetical protein